MAIIVRNMRVIDGRAQGAGAARPSPAGPCLRVAIASEDGKRLNAHFGFARRLMVYDVMPRAHRLVQVTTFAPEASGADPSESDTIAPKVVALAGCHLLFVLAIGPPAAARVIGANVHPVKVSTPETIPAVIARVQAMMTGKQPPWLRKILAEDLRR